MIAHVAEAGEDRGRVVLRLKATTRPSAVALDAAVRVARAFGSEIESLYVQEHQLFDLASYSFVREVSWSGQAARTLDPGRLEREAEAMARVVQAQVAEYAGRHRIKVRTRTVRDEPVRALAAACAEFGPWNVVALAEPFHARDPHALAEMFDSVPGTTGLVIAGPRARIADGPVVAAIEEIDRLAPMLRAASRLAGVGSGEIRLVLMGSDHNTLSFMDGQARLVLGEVGNVRLEAVRLVEGGETAARILKGSNAGFIIAQYGGFVVPADGEAEPLSEHVECPVFLVR